VPLGGRSRFCVFVSSGNVYADHSSPGQNETTPAPPALGGDVMESMATYGEAKVSCEQFVLNRFGPSRS
jgi:2'-hydroxyisoflavone reductase